MIFKRTFEECVSLFSYQRSLLSRRLTDSFDILSCCFRLVKNFFYFFSNPFESFLFRILSCFVFLRRNSDIISSVFWFVNKFFQIFWFFQTSTFSGISWIPAVPRQLPKTALLGYHGVSSLSTLIFHYIDEIISHLW